MRTGGDRNQALVVYLLCAAVLTGMALWPVWGARFLPMQDYPQHLSLAYVLADFDNPAFNWAEHYRVHFTFGPYSLYYIFVRASLALVDIEHAGKLWVSLYFILIGAYAVTESVRRARASDPMPWTALLMLPLGYSQVYYLGFQNYLLSIPVLLFALRALEDTACDKPGRLRALALLGWLLVLFLVHPYTMLVFIVLASAAALLRRRESWFRRSLAIPAGLLVVLVVFYLAPGQSFAVPEDGRRLEWMIDWWPFGATLRYASMMFTGMRITDGLSVLHLGIWCAVLVSSCVAWYRCRNKPLPLVLRVQLGLCVLGVLVLPFWLGQFSYFNTRLAPIAYFIGVLALSRLKLARWQAAIVICSAALLLAMEVPQHQVISEEIEEILPVLAEMDPNARVLPVYGRTQSPHLDPKFFYQFHAHEHYYYHLLVGGGANPLLFPSAKNRLYGGFSVPVRFRRDANLPSLQRGVPFGTVAAQYRYLLIRDPEGKFASRLADSVSAQSGAWTLVDMAAR